MLNKTPEAAAKKIKSAHRTLFSRYLILFLILFSILFLAIFFSGLKNDKPTAIVQEKNTKSCLRIQPDNNACDFYLENADTNVARAQGLSGRVSMAEKEGMLFIFNQESNQCFWMKDMRFPLDIIWLNSQNKIVKIEPNVLPDTYPMQFCAISQYVVELNRGIAAKNNLKIGQKLAY